MGEYFRPCFLFSPDDFFKEVMIVAWARSRTPTVCACFVVACFNFMPSFSTTSC